LQVIQSYYWRIKEMTQAGVIERLIEMGREWVKTPPLDR
jgi:hypothetical protein